MTPRTRTRRTWEFLALPSSGDLTFAVTVLATDAVDGARGVQARFFFSWRPSEASRVDGPASGHAAQRLAGR